MWDLVLAGLIGVLLVVDATLAMVLRDEHRRYEKAAAALRWWQRHSQIRLG